ncbi:MAG: hypothetical protein ACFB14_05485 [Leptolyngbyaceae cyanobacterium]
MAPKPQVSANMPDIIICLPPKKTPQPFKRLLTLGMNRSSGCLTAARS